MSTCRDVETSLGRPLPTLSEAERLHLEQHLSECDTCRRESALSRVVGDMIRAAPSNLSESARERALSGAFARAANAPPVSQGATRRLRVGLGVAAAAVLLLGSSVLLIKQSGSDVVGRAAPLTTAVQAAGAVATRVADDVGAVPTEETWVESITGESRTFGGARVAMAERTRVRFQRATNTLELSQGQVTLDVEPQHERPFAVLTQGFRVEVLGTQFVVSPEHVTVLGGHVEVRDRESNRLISDLRAGQSYRQPTLSAATTTSTTVDVAPSTNEPAAAARKARRGSHQVGAAANDAPRPTPAEESVGELIRKARSALGEGDVDAARTLVHRAEKAARLTSDRAEVATLDAECELLARRPTQAIAAYLRVADRYASLRAGENALFAAAQLSLREREAGSARKLFERYLTRYPAGRFADEARAHLKPAH